MKINILYEDNHIIVCIKPVGVLAQADGSKKQDMLTILKDYIKEKYQKPGNVYLGLVQRLDMNTSGVMVFAKTSKAASRLCEQIRNHDIFKKYLAICEGNITKSGTITTYLRKDEKLVKSFVCDKETGKKAILDYEVVEHAKDMTLVNILLHTGRHHQIRVSMSSINHPLVGDRLYGSSKEGKYYLHAYYLSFIHPVTKEVMKFKNIPHGELWDLFSEIDNQ